MEYCVSILLYDEKETSVQSLISLSCPIVTPLQAFPSMSSFLQALPSKPFRPNPFFQAFSPSTSPKRIFPSFFLSFLSKCFLLGFFLHILLLKLFCPNPFLSPSPLLKPLLWQTISPKCTPPSLSFQTSPPSALL